MERTKLNSILISNVIFFFQKTFYKMLFLQKRNKLEFVKKYKATNLA